MCPETCPEFPTCLSIVEERRVGEHHPPHFVPDGSLHPVERARPLQINKRLSDGPHAIVYGSLKVDRQIEIWAGAAHTHVHCGHLQHRLGGSPRRVVPPEAVVEPARSRGWVHAGARQEPQDTNSHTRTSVARVEFVVRAGAQAYSEARAPWTRRGLRRRWAQR